MQTHKLILTPIAVTLMLTAIGCDEEENKRLAEMAERHLERQAEQNRQVTELQREVAEGSRRLVEADAQARQEMVVLQREIQAERTEVGRQRDLLEGERRDLAAKRRLDPIIAAAITNIGFLLACLLPLVLCWYLLGRRVEPANDQAIAEVLLEDLVTDRPLLLPPSDNVRAIGLRTGNDNSSSPYDADPIEKPT
ncbi:hypothetical protein Pan97_16780 [Bremerella volcania]|uniref:Chromosome partition protein Smc n=1 Tax=Bremerella volcania TaxID=2527984 RepID=A0A518C601_9BACT|nr:hypothetical protein [Bremerella volcania]QDU74666.1 hypothetical protein Pan97_16780 [Bremerella volcania]